MSISSNLLSSKISDIHRLLISGKLTPSQLCELCLKRVDQTKSLNSLITVTEENARSQAEKSSQRFASGKNLGVLDGIPIAVKDNFMTKDIKTTCASKMLENFIPPYSATVVDRLIGQNGALLVGKANLDEFAMGCGGVDSIFGPCVNPWHSSLPFESIDRNSDKVVHSNEKTNVPGEWYISGGSSGGSAVAVASGIVFAALASDTGGSTRNPASHCGIVGFKPSYGTLSRYGLVPLTHSLDTPSIMGRTVEDVELVFQSIHGWDVKDSTSSKSNSFKPLDDNFPVEQLTIGLPKEYLPDFMSPEILSLINSIVDLLTSKGISVVPVSLPHTPYSLPCYSVINCCDVASNFACYDGIEYGHRSANVFSSSTDNNNNEANKTGKLETASKPKTFEEFITCSRDEAFGDNVKGRILAGNYFLLKENYENFFLKALKVRRLICQDFDKIFNGPEKVDLLLTPVTLTSAFRYSDWVKRDATDKSSGEDYCTQPANMAGLPALSLPCSLSPSTNLPLGLQIVGPRFNDNIVLAFSKYLENLVSFPRLVYKE
ncbi:glutamyl-tRNA(Gln) amidotransferase subunit A, mitochondrial [Tetranychus urticae]|uniref:Glutamyl-tRNA(Gln) amidotransferase subunit A, mitochondrial n=1 Tax=Tetranychus urticae TaxID=32264 RepID=T1JZK2_TETUR|nr:glutamyl-tRNA(Gln) amidotransferase subunit A, mitochondrial [Tetranychus urticae]